MKKKPNDDRNKRATSTPQPPTVQAGQIWLRRLVSDVAHTGTVAILEQAARSLTLAECLAEYAKVHHILVACVEAAVLQDRGRRKQHQPGNN